MSTVGFGEGATRQIQPGDTPDLNDGLLSRTIPTANSIDRGDACFLVDGDITLATQALAEDGYGPFVPIESVNNTSGADLPMSGVTAPQRIALRVLISTTPLNPGDYVKPSSTAGLVEKFDTGAAGEDEFWLKYARYLGKEAALLDKDSNSPFGESLSLGIVPDQTLTPTSTQEDDGNVGWFQLIESQAGNVVVST